MKTKVISAFPGTGKTYFAAHNGSDLKVVDLDSNAFTRGHSKEGKVRSADFPDNYIRAIKEQIGQADVLFVSIHREVREALQHEDIEYVLVYPDEGLRSEYIERYRRRRSPQSLASISVIIENWSAILEQLRSQKQCRHSVLKSGQYISDVIQYT